MQLRTSDAQAAISLRRTFHNASNSRKNPYKCIDARDSALPALIDRIHPPTHHDATRMDGLPESEDALLLVDSSPNSRQASRRTTDRPPAVPLSDASTGHRPPQQPPPGPSQSSSELTSLADEDDDEGNLIQVDSPSQATLALRTGAQGGSSRRVPSPATSAPPTQPQLLPLPLLSHALHTLFSSPPPSGGSPLALGWQLVRSSLASSHSSLSPREELELRRLDGALGVRVLACLKARSGVEEGWKEKGREVERSLGKAVSPPPPPLFPSCPLPQAVD